MSDVKNIVNNLLEGKSVRSVLESASLSGSEIESFIDLMDDYPIIKGDFFLWMWALVACSEKFSKSLKANEEEAEEDFEYWCAKNWDFVVENDEAPDCEKAGVTADQLENYVLNHVGDLYELYSISVDKGYTDRIVLNFIEK